MDNNESLAHTKWDCVYHIVWISKYRRKVTGKDRTLWTRGYYVSTVGINESVIKKYVREQGDTNGITD